MKYDPIRAWLPDVESRLFFFLIHDASVVRINKECKQEGEDGDFRRQESRVKSF